MLRYSQKVLTTLSLFYRYKNEFDLFIEDSNDEEFYKALIGRLLHRNVKLDKLISLGNKTQVIAACKSDQAPRARKRVYLVDGDIDLIYDNNPKGLAHLFVFDRYCVENFIIEENAILEILHDCIINDKEKIKKALSFENWLKGISNSLIELFLHYSLCHECNSGRKTVSNSIGTLCRQDKGINILDMDKVERLISEIRSDIVQLVGEENYLEKIYNRRQKWPSTTETLLRIVSGKDYLLPLLEFRFRKLKGKEKYHLKREALRLRLAKTCDLQPFVKLRDELNR